jgi:AhpD family alkylhydroperoxidase
MNTKTKLVNVSLALFILGSATLSVPARAEAKPSPAAAAARADIAKTLGFVPQFFLKLPEEMLPGAWDEMKTLQLNPSTALPGRTKELVGLAVAAQIPCRYCIVAHTEFAKLNGASETEIGEAVAMAAMTRHWSTFLNGIQTDEAKFRGEIAKIITNVKAASGKALAGKPIDVNVADGQTALAQATQMLGGYAPEFISRFPAVARAGAWRQFRDVQLSPTTAVSGKNKELMGLAVASQIPCRFCVIAHTEFAKLNGATDAEVTEAVAMASLTRDLSTLLNGMQVDEGQFRKDVDKLVKGATAAAAAKKEKDHTASR